MPMIMTPDELKQRLYYIAKLDRIWDTEARDLLTLKAAARRFAHEYGTVADATFAMMEGKFALPKADSITFWPGQPEFFHDNGIVLVNLYRERDFTPAEGDASLFLDHIALLLDNDPDACNFLLNFMAALVQFPDRKMAFAPLIIGGQGIGKSVLGNFLAELVGKHNARFADSGMLRSDFNDWMASTSLVVVNELSDCQTNSLATRLKDLITGESLSINPKGVARFQIVNRINFLMFSNETNAAKLDPDDRRYFVWESRATKQTAEYYTRLCEWFDGQGKRHVLSFLLSRDLSDFNPYAAPPQTQAREALIRDSLADGDRYLLEAFEAGDVPFDIDVCVANDIVDYVRSTNHLRMTPRQVVGFLRNYLKATNLGQRRIPDRDRPGRKPRMWAVRNAEQWLKATEADIAAYYVEPSTMRQRLRAAADSVSAPQPRRCMTRQVPNAAAPAANDSVDGIADDGGRLDLSSL